MMSEKTTITPTFTITAEMCRQNAMAYADLLEDVGNTVASQARLATIGTMWAMIGQLCCAIGDPDSPNKNKSGYSINVADNKPPDYLAERAAIAEAKRTKNPAEFSDWLNRRLNQWEGNR